jgi:atypical dual specificity phosphatase
MIVSGTTIVIALISILIALIVIYYQPDDNYTAEMVVITSAAEQELDGTWSEATEIVAGLFVGSARAANDLTMLRRKGIDAVLSAGTKFTADMYTQHRDVIAEHLVVTAKDVPEQNLIVFWNDTNAWLARHLDQRGARVLVHCQKGMSRSASIAAAFLIAHRNMSLDVALRTLKTRRAIVAPNRGFLQQLRHFEDLHARLWWPQSEEYLRFVGSLKRVDQQHRQE